MNVEERRQEILRKANTRLFKEKFLKKSTLLPSQGYKGLMHESPGLHQVDKRDGVVSLQRENLDRVRDIEIVEQRDLALYELRDRIDQYALHDYFQHTDFRSELLADPDELRGPYRRKYYLRRNKPDVQSQLAFAK